jgi:type IV pilus assembly protein PilV
MPVNARRIAGVSLIELLVSLVILSLGVLAVVALQLVAKRNNADAGQRTIAAQLAYDLIERMRGNSSPATLNAYRVAAVGRQSLATPNPNCGAAACTPAQLAAWDLWQWERALDGVAEQAGGTATGGLVMPTACVDGPAGGGDGLYTVTIVWRGTVPIPDGNAGTTTAPTPLGCGRNLQVSGEYVYGEGGNNDRFRRSVSISTYITARQS